MEPKEQPWIDGAVTPPKVGSVVRCRSKSSAVPPFVCEVEFSDAFWNEYYYVLEDSPRPFVAPEPPMPEVVKDLNGLAPWVKEGNGVCTVCSVEGVCGIDNGISVSAPTKYLAYLCWNAAIEAVRGVKP